MLAASHSVTLRILGTDQTSKKNNNSQSSRSFLKYKLIKPCHFSAFDPSPIDICSAQLKSKWLQAHHQPFSLQGIQNAAGKLAIAALAGVRTGDLVGIGAKHGQAAAGANPSMDFP